MKRAPERTCIVCRRAANKRELIRLVIKNERLMVDSNQEHRTRGAYVHASRECWSKMNQPGKWERALKSASGSISKETLEQVMMEMQSKYLS